LRGRSVVAHAPAVLRPVMTVLRLLPAAVYDIVTDMHQTPAEQTKGQ
jgi:hypothetical protein